MLARTLLALIAAGLLTAPTAHASFPGDNGDLVLSLSANSELSSDLFSLPPAGGPLTRLTTTGDTDVEGTGYAAAPEAAPDGKSLLAYTTAVASRVATLPVGGELAEAPNDLGLRPPLSFSPAGSSYVGANDDGLFEVPLDGGEPRQIVAGGKLRLQAPRWSPDGKLLAVEVLGGPKKAGIWLYDAQTGKPVRRVSKRGTEADWAPDGKRLVFRTNYQQREIEGGASGGNLYVVRRDGTGRRTLVHRENVVETQPTWSPDGRRVAFVSLGFSGGDVSFDVRPSLWTVKASGGKPRRVKQLEEPYVEEGYYHAPELTWLPVVP